MTTQFSLDTLFTTYNKLENESTTDPMGNNAQDMTSNANENNFPTNNHLQNISENENANNAQHMNSNVNENNFATNNHLQNISENENADALNVEDLTYYPPEKRTSQRKRSAPDRYSPDAAIALLTRYALGISDTNLPDSYIEAMDHPEKDKWIEAMRTELDELKRRQVLELTKAPKGVKTIPCRWVFDRKKNSIGDILLNRARLVAKGFLQRYGVHFIEVFSPVVKYTTVRIVFAIATHNDWIIIRIDVRRAFLYGLLDEEIYIDQPEGFIISGKEDLVYRLRKAIYGLRQSPRAWRNFLLPILTKLGAVCSHSDPSLFTVNRGSDTVIIIVYVDDILFTGSNPTFTNQIISKIQEKLEIRVETEDTKFVGFTIERNLENKSTKLHNQLMIQELLEKYELQDSNPGSTPMEPHYKVEKSGLTDKPYRELIGSLLYLSITCRPKISYATSYLSRFMDKATNSHWKMAMRILRYLKGTSNHGIIYQKSSQPLQAFSDSDFAGDLNDRKSTSGFVFIIDGGAISWRSKKQSIVAQSTTEAEYVAMSFTVRESLLLKSLFKDLHINSTYDSDNLRINTDDTQGLDLSKDNLSSEKIEAY